MSKPPKQHPKPNYNKLQRDKAKAGSRQPNAAKPPSAATLARPIVASTTPSQVVTLELLICIQS